MATYGPTAATAAGPLTAIGEPYARGVPPRERAADLERRFADPLSPDNPLGHEAFLRADANAELLPAGERLLEHVGLNREFVPRTLGGRFETVEGLVRVLRPVFRRDAALGLGYGATSFTSALGAWFAGSEPQQRRAADMLLSGGRLAVAYQELAHGNTFVRDEFSAHEAGAHFELRGEKRMLGNVERAGAVMVYARTTQGPGSRSHTVLLADLESAPDDRFELLPRRVTNGCRAMRFGGLRLTDLPLPVDSVVGEVGQGVELSLRSFQITRGALPSMLVALGDTCLRTAVRFADERGRHSATGMNLRASRPVFTAAFADLLLCDALCLATTRATSLMPHRTSGVYAASTRYLVPKILSESVYDMAIVLGRALYDKDGPYGCFQKHVRDLPVITLGHAGSASCLATVIPQLPLLAEVAWFGGEPAPGVLFEADGPLPPLDLGAFRPRAGHDPVMASLVVAAERGGADDLPGGADILRRLTHGFLGELRSLGERCRALYASGADTLLGPEMSALADRYAHVLAAAACLGVWRREREVRPEGFLAGPAWVTTALLRLAGRIGGLPGLRELPDIPEEFADRMANEALTRFDTPKSFDLYDTPLAG